MLFLPFALTLSWAVPARGVKLSVRASHSQDRHRGVSWRMVLGCFPSGGPLFSIHFAVFPLRRQWLQPLTCCSFSPFLALAVFLSTTPLSHHNTGTLISLCSVPVAIFFLLFEPSESSHFQAQMDLLPLALLWRCPSMFSVSLGRAAPRGSGLWVWRHRCPPEKNNFLEYRSVDRTERAFSAGGTSPSAVFLLILPCFLPWPFEAHQGDCRMHLQRASLDLWGFERFGFIL